jgi:hypothetical protein
MKRSVPLPFYKQFSAKLSSMMIVASLLVFILALGMIPAASGRQTGAIDFVARVEPTGGHPEPARAVTFFLLSKSFKDIQAEADAAEPAPNLNDFIAKQDGSPELLAWMKKHQIADLSGNDFVKALTPVDILAVPEFKDAYFSRNKSDPSIVLPQPKVKESEKKKNPEKYKEGMDAYYEELKRFIAANPDTLTNMYLSLEKINPGPQWKKLFNERAARTHRRAMELAQLKYLVIQTDTDMNGRGQMNGLAPGEYWLTTLDTEAMAGDARVRWDLPVQVGAGRTSIELSNLNGIETRTP